MVTNHLTYSTVDSSIPRRALPHAAIQIHWDRLPGNSPPVPRVNLKFLWSKEVRSRTSNFAFAQPFSAVY